MLAKILPIGLLIWALVQLGIIYDKTFPQSATALAVAYILIVVGAIATIL